MGHSQEYRKFCGILSGLQENPQIHALNQSPAKGSVKLRLKGNKLYILGCFKNLSSKYVAAHIHRGNPGINGPVVFTLTTKVSCNGGSFSPCLNRFILTEQQIVELVTGEYYINVHSINYPNGEIRAQIYEKSKTDKCGCDSGKCKQYLALVSGTNEVPPTNSTASGKIFASLNGNTLTISGSFTGLSSNYVGSHIHQGAAGVNGPVLFTLNPVTNLPPLSGEYFTVNNVFLLTDNQKILLHQSELYVNIHSVNFPNGEIRAQLIAL